MTDEDVARAREQLQGWIDEMQRSYRDSAELLGVPAVRLDDALSIVDSWQHYVDKMPLDELENSDWVTLHVDLATYLAEIMIQRYAGTWVVRAVPTARRGYRYLVEVDGPAGDRRVLDAFEVVAQEFHSPPIQVARMVANAEAARLQPDGTSRLTA